MTLSPRFVLRIISETHASQFVAHAMCTCGFVHGRARPRVPHWQAAGAQSYVMIQPRLVQREEIQYYERTETSLIGQGPLTDSVQLKGDAISRRCVVVARMSRP